MSAPRFALLSMMSCHLSCIPLSLKNVFSCPHCLKKNSCACGLSSHRSVSLTASSNPSVMLPSNRYIHMFCSRVVSARYVFIICSIPPSYLCVMCPVCQVLDGFLLHQLCILHYGCISHLSVHQAIYQ